MTLTAGCMKTAKTIGILAAIWVAACSKSGSSGSNAKNVPSYPFERTITNSEGKEIEATILGRSSTELVLELKSGKKRYRYEIDKLSLKDKLFANKLPVKEPPPHEPKTPNLEQVRIENVRKALTRLEEKQTELLKEHQDPSMRNNPTRQRAVAAKIQKVEWEMNELAVELEQLTGERVKIKTYRLRSGSRPRTKLR